jgi:hypothetical protein
MVASLSPGLEAAKATLQLASIVAPHAREALEQLGRALSPSAETGPAETIVVPMSGLERRQLEELTASNEKQMRAQEYEALASVLSLIPDITLGAQGISSPVVQAQIGGTLLSTFARLKGSGFSYEAGQHSYKANLHSILSSYERRAAEWMHQAKLALSEGEQVGKQMVAAGIRLRAAQLELSDHDQQIEHARATDTMLREKYTNEQLYDWLSGQLASAYFECYQLAYDVSKRAERAFRFELAAPDASFVKFGHWDGLHRGLMAGERLQHDLRRMEVAYLDQHRRGPELDKDIRLTQVDAGALVRLRLTGTCEVELPEALFDLDHATHFHRRIRSVRISIPCVSGAGVNGMLTLLRSSTRVSPSLDGGYARATDQAGAPADDPRFLDDLGAESIAFSTGLMDTGIAEGSADDGRYMPFEGRGVISRWRIELPRDFHAFNYDSITDAVLHVSYTARNGGRRLGDAATDELRANLNTLMRGADGLGGFARLFSLRHELPGWHVLTSPTGTRAVNLDLDGRFPILFRRRTIGIDRVELLFRGRAALTSVLPELRKVRLNGTALNGLAAFDGTDDTLQIRRGNVTWDPSTQTWPLSFANVAPAAASALDDVWLLCHYTVT